MYDNNDQWQTHENMNVPGMKLRPERSFWRRNRWVLIASVAVLVALFFSITTVYLLVNRPQASIVAVALPTATATTNTVPTEQPTSTPASSIAPTVIASPVGTPTPLTTASKNYQFICITYCDSKLAVTLNSLTINTTSQSMKWDFMMTNNGALCTFRMSSLILEDPAGNMLKADGGTFIGNMNINSSQALPIEATFSSVPKQGTLYNVTLQIGCGDPPYAEYQVELFQY